MITVAIMPLGLCHAPWFSS